MKSKLLLRIASVLMLLHTAGHTMGALTWKEAPNAAIAQVISGMQSNHFNFMGRSVSLAGFFEGYGVSMILVLLFLSALLWLQSGSPSKPVLLLTGVFLLGFGVSEYIYFFPFAAAFSLLAGLCTLLALRKRCRLVGDNTNKGVEIWKFEKWFAMIIFNHHLAFEGNDQ